MGVSDAAEALGRGEVILVFDSEGRERETDLVVGAQFVKPETVELFRRDAGGLLCVALGHEYARRLGLPYMTEIYEAARGKLALLKKLVPRDLPYDERSAFSLNVNHRKSFTGVNDDDRSLTVKGLVGLGDADEFAKRFRSPGHVHLLIGAKNLLEERMGHTELSLALAQLAGIEPAVMICEMLGKGKSLGKEEAQEYAGRKGLQFVEGKEIIGYFAKGARE